MVLRSETDANTDESQDTREPKSAGADEAAAEKMPEAASEGTSPTEAAAGPEEAGPPGKLERSPTKPRNLAARGAATKDQAPCTPAVAYRTESGNPAFGLMESKGQLDDAPAMRPTTKAPARSRSPSAPRGRASAVKDKPVAVRGNGPDLLSVGETDLDAPELYLNRELTWLNFNSRVLNEAQDKRNPLLERLKFLAIASSNLDEFFMKRVGGLKQQVAASVHQLSVDGRSPQQQISECAEAVKAMQICMHQVYLDLVKSLEKQGIVIATYKQLTAAEREQIREAYLTNVLPLVTPLALDPAHPFPFISNLSLNLLVALRYRDEEEPLMNRIKVPLSSYVPRFLRVDGGHRFIPLEEVMAHNLDLLFPEMEIESCEVFRVTRNANTELDEEQAEDLLSMIETELRYRKFAPFVRLEIGPNMDSVRRGMLSAELGLDESADVFESDILLGMRDLMELASLELPELHDPDHHPITNTRLQETRSIFHMIREAGSILLHLPYESFATSIERFVREASRDPKVRAIKMTLYRTSADTEILEYLIEAARNGKQVAVAVELKARFDEAANIRWASRLEDAGIHVTYGVVGLKTHAKAILVVRQDYSGLHRYAHIGTGNYHAGTARIYADLGLLTCDPDIGHDLTELFNYLTSGCKAVATLPQASDSPQIPEKGIAGEDRTGDRVTFQDLAGADPLEDQCPGRRGHHGCALSCLSRRGEGRVDRPRHLPIATWRTGFVGERLGRQRARTLLGARAHLLLPQWR